MEKKQKSRQKKWERERSEHKLAKRTFVEKFSIREEISNRDTFIEIYLLSFGGLRIRFDFPLLNSMCSRDERGCGRNDVCVVVVVAQVMRSSCAKHFRNAVSVDGCGLRKHRKMRNDWPNKCQMSTNNRNKFQITARINICLSQLNGEASKRFLSV